MTLESTGWQLATEPAPWRDPNRSVDDRVEILVQAMHLEEKVAQLYGSGSGRPRRAATSRRTSTTSATTSTSTCCFPRGLGQLTRPFGTAPVDPVLGAVSLMRTQAKIVAAGRFGIPALAHEECLAGFAAWGATAYPVPLSWGATFDPELVGRMAAAIGRDLRSVGIHQGLAPVLDVVRDARWGRVEETIGEDPYLVGDDRHRVTSAGCSRPASWPPSSTSSAIRRPGPDATWRPSPSGRGSSPMCCSRRSRWPCNEGRARSVMNAYTDLDGVPSAADRELLTGLLREIWGFEGTLVADYFSVAFLRLLHGVAGSWEEAAAAALVAGIDVELPYGQGVRRSAARGGRPTACSTSRSSTLRCAGCCDRRPNSACSTRTGRRCRRPCATPTCPIRRALRGTVDLDSADNRELAAALAERAVILLRNDGAAAAAITALASR